MTYLACSCSCSCSCMLYCVPSLPLDYIRTMQTSIKIHVIPAVLMLTQTRAAENYNICFNLVSSIIRSLIKISLLTCENSVGGPTTSN